MGTFKTVKLPAYQQNRIQEQYLQHLSSEIRKEKARQEDIIKKQDAITKYNKSASDVERKVVNKVKKFLDKRAASHNVLRKNPQTRYVVQTKPTPYEDKSRFFKEKWEEEKRNLFFGK